jgi:hypothetical protein
MSSEERGAQTRARLFTAPRVPLCPGLRSMERLPAQCGTRFLEFFTALTMNSLLYL